MPFPVTSSFRRGRLEVPGSQSQSAFWRFKQHSKLGVIRSKKDCRSKNPAGARQPGLILQHSNSFSRFHQPYGKIAVRVGTDSDPTVMTQCDRSHERTMEVKGFHRTIQTCPDAYRSIVMSGNDSLTIIAEPNCSGRVSVIGNRVQDSGLQIQFDQRSELATSHDRISIRRPCRTISQSWQQKALKR